MALEVEFFDTKRNVPASLIAAQRSQDEELGLYEKARKILKDRILTEGKNLGHGILKVNSFVNHRVDCKLMDVCGRAFAEHYRSQNVTLVLTAQTSGILPAQNAARHLDVPLLFAREKRPITMDHGVYEAGSKSRTRGHEYTLFVDADYLHPTDRVLVVDDFLSTGTTAVALLDIIKQAGAECVGFAFLIEKGFEKGREKLVDSFKQEDHTIPIEPLVNITALDEDGTIRFE